MKHALIFGDTHVPFHDPKALAVIRRLLIDVQPDVVIHIGDLIDCWQISDFDKEITRRDSLQENINTAAALLKEWYMLTPNAERYYLEGNHEFRLTRTISRMKEAQREVAKLDVFQQHVTWPGILERAGVSRDMWEFVPTQGQARRRIFPKLITKHGTRVTKWSAMTAKAEWERYGKSGLSGHTHRLGQFFHNDFNGAHTWIETGCTCDINPTYCADPDWQQGAVMMTFSPGKVGSARDKAYTYFNAEPIYIQEGHAMWRDKKYNAPKGATQ